MQDITLIVALSFSALLILGTCACLHLFLSLKREFRALKKKVMFLEAEVKASLTPLEASNDASNAAPVAPRPAALDEERRLEILRLYGRGKQPSEISAKLNLPANEADLLFRIHNLVSGSA